MRLDDVSLVELHVESFRPFGPRVSLAKLGRLNLITGPNNVGKSSLLMPLRRLTRLDERLVPMKPSPDGHGSYAHVHSARFLATDLRGLDPVKISLQLEVLNFEKSYAESLQREAAATGERRAIEIELSGRELFGIRFSSSSAQVLAELRPTLRDSGLLKNTEGDDITFARDVAAAFASRVIYVPTYRIAGTTFQAPDISVHEERRFDGGALLAQLLRWCLPDPETGVPALAGRLNELNEAVSSILDVTVKIWPTGDQQVRIKIGAEAALRLEDVGQGINQIVTIVAAAMSLPEPPLLILEEPEVCLHPGLQRRLVDYLVERQGQTFITTHSNHIVDASIGQGRLFIVRKDVGLHDRLVLSLDDGLLQAASDLGVAASSIAAATAVIWVEGPSDALYVRYWLRCHPRGQHLKERRDFTFAFHAGSLLHHVGLGDDAVNLLAVHPGFFLVADSDRTARNGAVKHQYLQRLIDDPRFRDRIWVTEPKEVEGYLSDADLTGSVPAQPSSPYDPLGDRLDHLGLARSLSEKKPKLATDVLERMGTPNPTRLQRLDLEARIDALVTFVETCRARLPLV